MEYTELKSIKRWLMAIFYILCFIAGSLVVAPAVGAVAPDGQYPPGYDYTCPEGTYPIGNGACKNEPSGCPFYENVGPKGCYPPPDIQCSDDTWSYCWYVGDKPQEPVSKPTTPAAGTTTPKNGTPAPSGGTRSDPNGTNTPQAGTNYAPPAAPKVNETPPAVDIEKPKVNKKDDVPPAILATADVSKKADSDTKKPANDLATMTQTDWILAGAAMLTMGGLIAFIERKTGIFSEYLTLLADSIKRR